MFTPASVRVGISTEAAAHCTDVIKGLNSAIKRRRPGRAYLANAETAFAVAPKEDYIALAEGAAAEKGGAARL